MYDMYVRAERVGEGGDVTYDEQLSDGGGGRASTHGGRRQSWEQMNTSFRNYGCISEVCFFGGMGKFEGASNNESGRVRRAELINRASRG